MTPFSQRVDHTRKSAPGFFPRIKKKGYWEKIILKTGMERKWGGFSLRLSLLANNARFLIVPKIDCPNLASRVLALCTARLSADWQAAWASAARRYKLYLPSKELLRRKLLDWAREAEAAG